jgi:glycosyltransferase involved in cell wall biosynthesis
MATYNGAPYVARQLHSILEQLDADDEVIVVDDCSTDETLEVVRRLADPRIRVLRNDRNRGEVVSFSRALLAARHDFIFLADQDDVWMPGRVALMSRELAAGTLLVGSNFEWMDAEERPIAVAYDGLAARDATRHLKNIYDIFIGKTTYFGCAMALHRRLAGVVAPIPRFVESHDGWIAIAANVLRSTAHIEQPTLRKRKHASNATSTVSNRNLYMRVRARLLYALGIAVVALRVLRGGGARPAAVPQAPAKRPEAETPR